MRETVFRLLTFSHFFPQGRPLKVSPQQPPSSPPVPPPPKTISASALDTKLDNEEILNIILPPRYSFFSNPWGFLQQGDHFKLDFWWCREWMEGNQLWVQPVSSTPATRIDVINLVELLDLRLQERRARETGICPIRRELYTQCFGESNYLERINCLI